MAGSSERSEWRDGFLFVGNHMALDFLNTKPILAGAAQELLSDPAALERWLEASGIIASAKQRALIRSWRDRPGTKVFLKELRGFRERWRAVIFRIENGQAPGAKFLMELNQLLQRYPERVSVAKQGSRVKRQVSFHPRKPEDLWSPIAAAVAEMLSEVEPSRIRKCESEACVVHFCDTSKKGARRWCSMNICGNKLKVAAYQERRRRD